MCSAEDLSAFGDHALAVLPPTVEWGIIDRVPCTIKLLKAPKTTAAFYDCDDYERLVEAAQTDITAHLIVLLGGEAGLRLARSSRWNGPTSTCRSGNCAWRSPNERAT